jgi:hypothetical protein
MDVIVVKSFIYKCPHQQIPYIKRQQQPNPTNTTLKFHITCPVKIYYI